MNDTQLTISLSAIFLGISILFQVNHKKDDYASNLVYPETTIEELRKAK
jgi:hypothetical protein